MEVNMSAGFLKIGMIAGAAFGAMMATEANAQEKVEAGLLTCGVRGGTSFIFGSSRDLRCVFRTAPGEEGERYEGQIQKYGLDVGVTGNAILTWTVLAPSHGVYAGALAGKYYGVAADASAGVGGGANVLVGGSNNTISLQPLSVQGQTGLNAAVAVAEVELHPYFDEAK
jgi:hypothetical protein